VDARTGFAVGGFIVGATAVAVACAATLSNSAALADVPGASAGVGVVRVSPAPAATPTPRDSAPALSAPDLSAPAPSGSAEVVPAPEPRDVSSPAPPRPADPQAAPEAPAPAQPDYFSLTKDQIQDEAVSTGSWDLLRVWAVARGWSTKRIDHWIGLLQGKTTADKESSIESYRTKTPANAGTESGRHWSGVKKTQSPEPPHGD